MIGFLILFAIFGAIAIGVYTWDKGDVTNSFGEYKLGPEDDNDNENQPD